MASAHSRLVIEGDHRLPIEAIQGMWEHSRSRLRRWMQAFDENCVSTDEFSGGRRSATNDPMLPVVAEVFVSEILTRVWAATLTASDHVRNVRHAAPLAVNVFDGHAKARHSALTWMVDRIHDSEKNVVTLDQLRRRSERWTDLLLGHLVVRYPVAEFAFDRDRAYDFGSDQRSQQIENPQATVWKLIQAGLRISFPDTRLFPLPFPAWSNEIAENIQATFPEGSLECADGCDSENSLTRWLGPLRF